MKVKILGWRNEELSIVNRLEKGFEELGHEVAVFNDKPDLLIAINPDVYDEAIKRALGDLDKGFRGMAQFPSIDKEPKQQKPALPFNPIRRI